LPHWEDVTNFISRHETTVVPSIELDHQNEMDWAASVVNDEDNWEWMRDEDNVTSLEASQREALREYIKEVTEKHLSQRFDIHVFFRLPEEERNLFGYTANELKAQERKLLPKNHPDLSRYMAWNGKSVAWQFILKIQFRMYLTNHFSRFTITGLCYSQ
jgi:hypothetical protein